jgi:hypothetical protein
VAVRIIQDDLSDALHDPPFWYCTALMRRRTDHPRISGRGLVVEPISGIPKPDIVRDYQRGFDQPMADGPAMTRARHGQTSPLFVDDVEEGSRRSPDDLNSPIVHLPIDMQ